MTNVGPESVYGLFLLVAPVAVAVPVAVGAWALDRWTALGFAGGLTVVIAGGAGLAGVLAVATGFSVEGATIPAAILVGYVLWPLAVAGGVIRGATGEDLDRTARLATGGWLLAQVVGVVAVVGTAWLGTGLLTAVATSPGVLGIGGYTGYLALMAVVGVLAGLVGVAARGGRGDEQRAEGT